MSTIRLERLENPNTSNGGIDINSSGNVGIGTATPGAALEVAQTTDMAVIAGTSGTNNSARLEARSGDGTTSGKYAYIRFNNSDTNNQRYDIGTYGTNDLTFRDLKAASNRMTLDTSGRLLVGTSTNIDANSKLQIESDSNDKIVLKATSAVANNGSQVNWYVGSTYKAAIYGGNDSGSSSVLVFSTAANGASSPTERMRINSTGFLKVSNTGSYISSTGAYNEFRTSDGSSPVVYLTADNTSFSSDMLFLRAERASSSSFYFLVCRNSGLSNNAILLRGDGNAFADGTWSGGGADYAEYFEWSDGNTSAEDRRGTTVVLDGDKIRKAVANEDPIGVISGNPSVVGDADVNQWKHKHLRDEFGSYVLDENNERQLNPDYNPDQEYVSRENRPEWDCVGLMGKLRIRKGQPTGSRWIKMRDISDSVEEWLVR